MRIAKEGRLFAGVLAVGTVAVGLFLHPAVAIVPLALLVFTVWFFRDPERETPAEPEALISPADGKIIEAGPERISVFMNVFNVHVCRSPTAGVVETVQHTPGRFLSAYRDAASEHNERLEIVVADGERRQSFTLVAGLIARRIVCHVAPGQRLAAGQRVGLIQFGSRFDLAVPPGGRVEVALGQKVVAGESILARHRS